MGVHQVLQHEMLIIVIVAYRGSASICSKVLWYSVTHDRVAMPLLPLTVGLAIPFAHLAMVLGLNVLGIW